MGGMGEGEGARALEEGVGGYGIGPEVVGCGEAAGQGWCGRYADRV
jgi:hypothetical protein